MATHVTGTPMDAFTIALICACDKLYPGGIGCAASYHIAPKKSMSSRLRLFPKDMPEGEMYDVLVLSELVTLLLKRERQIIERIRCLPPSRSDLYATTEEVTGGNNKTAV